VMTIQARLLTVMAAAASASALIVRHKIEKWLLWWLSQLEPWWLQSQCRLSRLHILNIPLNGTVV
jgi:hypothetical protein